MKEYRADLHIHTVLSPCGDLEMSPENILAAARNKNIDILGITDHNHTGNALLVREMAEEYQILVLPGAEVTTREEVHCLAFFPSGETLVRFQNFLEERIIRIPNRPELLGYQILLERGEKVVDEVEYYLGSSVDASIEEVADAVHLLEGIFIPAHIDRQKNSLYSQLGFLPAGLNFDALEVSWRAKLEDFLASHPEVKGKRIVRSSDAHYMSDIGRITTVFLLGEPTCKEVWMAFRGENGRKIIAA